MGGADEGDGSGDGSQERETYNRGRAKPAGGAGRWGRRCTSVGVRVASKRRTIPPAILREVIIAGSDRPRRAEVAAVSWIVASSPVQPNVLAVLLADLYRGEAEAITLAEKRGGELPLGMDDGKGRRIARARGLDVIGSAGVLVLAKRKGRLGAIHPVLEDLLAVGLYLGPAARQQVLTRAGES